MEPWNKHLRLTLRIAIPCLLIPTAVLAGGRVAGERRHLLLSLLVASLAILLFVAGFERRRIGTRRTVLVAVMIALSVMGRLIPFFKPITALTVLAALYLGSEAGFLVGALSALLSNFYFGQGPWTPFQMLAWGMIGLLAGLLASPLKKSRAWLLFFGALSGVAFSAVMDLWTVIWYHGAFDGGLYLTALLTSAPHTALYAVSNVIFLWALAKPFGEKLERIKIKYGV